MKGCGFHQSGTAQHWHWALCGRAVVFSVLAVLLLPVSFALRLTPAQKARSSLYQSGQWQGHVRQPWVGQGSGEMALLFALGGCSGWMPQGLSCSLLSTNGQLKAWSTSCGMIWFWWGPGKLLTAVCQWCVCRAGSSNTITLFAFLVLSIYQFACQGLQVTVKFPWVTFLFCARVNMWLIASCQMMVCLPFNGIFLLNRMAAFCLSGEGCKLKGVWMRWQVIGRPGILVPGSSQVFGCPFLSPALTLWILHTA